MYIGHNAIRVVFWDNEGSLCYKGEKTWFLYYANNEYNMDQAYYYYLNDLKED
ncbi:hypothetical protein [Peribacillus simplex]|uniref:hypothetical protein n=1 Tax=Peribacillus simplex TaxID=1478 RepID=UPI0025A285E5|nr:hypothetical protein [Peribacillus simplex]